MLSAIIHVSVTPLRLITADSEAAVLVVVVVVVVVVVAAATVIVGAATAEQKLQKGLFRNECKACHNAFIIKKK